MARQGVNKVVLIGRVGKDPEVKEIQTGSFITNITIATSESWKDKNTGEKKESVEWHRVVFFGKLAEIAGQYLKKGSKVYIEGKLQTRKWQDQSGADRYTTEIVANEMQMLDSKGSQEAQQSPMTPIDRPVQRKMGGMSSAAGDSMYTEEDNIPF